MKTKKMINSADDIISELIDGMVGAHPDILTLEGQTGRAVVAINGPRDGKVGIVLGGGSGHEPAFSGYVGKGFADAVAVGNVFASPSPDQIVDAALAANGGVGVLFLYGNYTGDVMNFSMAVEQLSKQDIHAASVLVTDDVASAPADKPDERRGIAGGFFVFKCAGAAADLGFDFETVSRLSKHANDMTRSSGVALGACSLPQTCRANFEIGPEDMEVGMGIHGEPGIARTKLQSADAVVDQLLDLILADMPLERGDRVAILVNGLGSTSLMELYILHRHLRARLTDLGVEIHQSWVGNYVTALEMAGASISLMKLDQELAKLLDHPCHTPALQVGTVTVPTQKHREIRHKNEHIQPPMQLRENLIAQGDITPAIFKDMMFAVAETISKNKDWLCELDGFIGDADHGITMDIGWRAVRDGLIKMENNETISMMCEKSAKLFLGAVGASVGPLYATGFERAGQSVIDRLHLDNAAIHRWLTAMVQGIIERGGAKPGDKTMVDAWGPAIEAAKLEYTVLDSFCAASAAAKRGMRATCDMQAAKGRSSKLGARSVGHIDPGAASAFLILSAMDEAAQKALG